MALPYGALNAYISCCVADVVLNRSVPLVSTKPTRCAAAHHPHLPASSFRFDISCTVIVSRSSVIANSFIECRDQVTNRHSAT
jgi:hypothetical protein